MERPPTPFPNPLLLLLAFPLHAPHKHAAVHKWNTSTCASQPLSLASASASSVSVDGPHASTATVPSSRTP